MKDDFIGKTTVISNVLQSDWWKTYSNRKYIDMCVKALKGVKVKNMTILCCK